MSITIHWVLFKADPSLQPPFGIQLGTSENGNKKEISIENCQHIPDAIEKLKKWVTDSGAVIPSRFTLLYPIYLQAMGSDYEDTMHQVAWLIKDEADKNSWGFGRVDGLDGSKKEDFYL
jgi:hypothetical protein